MSRQIVVLGMMTRMPVAGAVWQTVHYLVGLRRLGFDPYYVEAHARTPTMFMEHEEDDGSGKAAAFIDGVLREFDLGGNWAYHALHDGNACYGLSEQKLRRLYRSAELIVNLHGSHVPLPEHAETGRLIYVETDPVELEIELHDGNEEALAFVAPHQAFFTWGLNYGNSDCRVPVPDGLVFHPSPPPVVLDLWQPNGKTPGPLFTTVGNWRQWGRVRFEGDDYTWSKHLEFEKFLELPRKTGQEFELALGTYTPADRQRLEEHGWRVRDATTVSESLDAYRDYLAGSRGEFTVAKDQNVRLRSGWFSERSAAYLASGRPVITQDTGFGSYLPTGEGLFAFSTLDEAVEAVRRIDADYATHARSAREIAREYFDAAVVLGDLLEAIGVDRPRRSSSGVRARSIPIDLDITVVSRRPTRLTDTSIEAIAAAQSQACPVTVAESDPNASIVVVSYDTLPFTKLCLECVLENTRRPPYELIVVDNGSRDGSIAYLRSLASRCSHVRVIENGRNRGFAAAVNQGLAAARGDVLVILNSDTVVADDWLERLAAQAGDERIGLVGPATNRAGNEADVSVRYRTYGEFLDFARAYTRAHSGKLADVRTPVLFCAAIRREVYERVGPLDERYETGLLEDDDLAMSVRAAGYRTVCTDDVFVHHFGEASFGKLFEDGRYMELLRTNQRRFEEKWGEAWQPYPRRPDCAYDELVARIRRRIDDLLPGSAAVGVVSKGDARFLELGGRRACHFPPGEGGEWAGYHPADSNEAIAHVESLRSMGFDYLVFPSTGLWWLDHYAGLREHLLTTGRVVFEDAPICVIVSL